MADFTRLQYFHRQLLEVADFKVEQNYHQEMRRLHNRRLHTWGVVDGLTVKAKDDKTVTIQPGMAMDASGREMETSSAVDKPVPNDLGNTLCVTIQHVEADTEQADGDPNHFKRTVEKFDIQLLPQEKLINGVTVILSRVILEAGKIKTIDDGQAPNQRRYSGAKGQGDFHRVGIGLSGPETKLHIYDGTLRVDRDTAMQSRTKSLELRRVYNKSFDGTALTVDIGMGEGQVNLVAGAELRTDGENPSGYKYLGIRGASRLALHDGEIHFYVGGVLDDKRRAGDPVSWIGGKPALAINPSGNVGIGTTAPSHLLHLYKDGVDAGFCVHTVNSGNPKLQLLSEGNQLYEIRADRALNRLIIARPGVAGDMMAFDPNTGNVGVGTPDPGAYKLNVGKSGGQNVLYLASDFGLRGDDRLNLIRFGTDGDYQILHKAAGAFGRNTLAMHVQDIDAFGIYSSGWTPLLEVTGGDGNMYVRGNAGIGTTTPLQNLHIHGVNNPILFRNVVTDDKFARPALAITGDYPELNLFSSVGNTSHGPTIRLGAYDDDQRHTFKHWVIGTAGRDARFLDLGFAENNINPHAGIRDWGGGRTVLTLVKDANRDGYVGIGKIDPQFRLHVSGTGEVSDGPQTIRLGTRGDSVLDVDFALNKRGMTIHGNDPKNKPALLQAWSSDGVQWLNRLHLGYEGSLEVSDRMRIKSGVSGTAGIWMHQSGIGDRAFVGMVDNDQVGFWGNTGAGWGLVMNTANGNVGIGTVPSTDTKLRINNPGGGRFLINDSPSGAEWSALGYYKDGQVKWDNGIREHGNQWYVWSNAFGFALTIQHDNGNVGIGGDASIRRSLNVVGNIEYSQLTKLDVAERDVNASIRAHDLWFGHSSRPGKVVDDNKNPSSIGRALVDWGKELHINYNGDWPNGVRYHVKMDKSSSRDLKENITALTDEEAFEILQGLNPVKFNLKKDTRKLEHLGFIAEDTHYQVASLDRKAVNHDHIVAALTRILKNQQAVILTLNQRVGFLENRISI